LTDLVTVVTPSYNQGRFIEATLRSVARQEHTPVEHLVLDAGSTDGTHAILERYAGERGLRWRAEPDEGMYDAVNTGLREARGTILAYLNTDDLYLPWTLSTVVAAFRRHPEVDFVYGDVVKVDEKAGSLALIFAPPFSAAYVRRLGSFFQPAVFWRRSVVDGLGTFDAGLRFGGDLDYWIRALDQYRFHKLDEVLAVERIHPDAKSSAQAAELHAEEREIRARYERLPRLLADASRVAERGRTWSWRRAYWIAFAAACRQETPRGRWSRFITACRPTIRPAALLAAQLPLVGNRNAARALSIAEPGALGLDG